MVEHFTGCEGIFKVLSLKRIYGEGMEVDRERKFSHSSSQVRTPDSESYSY